MAGTRLGAGYEKTMIPFIGLHRNIESKKRSKRAGFPGLRQRHFALVDGPLAEST
jgi:hypothetical protein